MHFLPHLDQSDAYIYDYNFFTKETGDFSCKIEVDGGEGYIKLPAEDVRKLRPEQIGDIVLELVFYARMSALKNALHWVEDDEIENEVMDCQTLGCMERHEEFLKELILEGDENDGNVHHYRKLLKMIKATRRYGNMDKRERDEKNFKMGPKPGFIYLFYGNNHYKIGYSKNVQRRLYGFKNLPFSVELIHSFKTSDMVKDEGKLHDKFANKRIKGEWFNLAPDDVEYIKNVKGIEDEKTVS